MSENKKKFIDRLQFVGIIGPFVVLLTLFSTLLKGSGASWYLFVTTLVAFPLCWKWGFKGFLVSLALLAASGLAMTSFFPHTSRFWQLCASTSLSLGLFVTYQGFEEIKAMMTDLTIESQSRLDNLIQLDDLLKSSQEEWVLLKKTLLSQKEEQSQLLLIAAQKENKLEKTTQIMQVELEQLQENQQLLKQALQAKGQEVSSLKVDSIAALEKQKQLQEQLNQSQSEREHDQLFENERLSQENASLKNNLYSLQQNLEAQNVAEADLNDHILENKLIIQKMEETLKQKLLHIKDLDRQLALGKDALEEQSRQLDHLKDVSYEKDQLINSYKQKVYENEQSLNLMEQKKQELDHNIQQLKSQLADQHKDYEKRFELYQENEQLQHNENKRNRAMVIEREQQIAELENMLAGKEQTIEGLQHHERVIEAKLIELEHLESEQALTAEKDHKELTNLNETRFALFQAKLDVERLKKQNLRVKKAPIKRHSHWLLEVESLLKREKVSKHELQRFSKEFSTEIVTLNQSKALYRQLRSQFEEKNRVLEEAREKRFKVETQLEKLRKLHEQEMTEESQIENNLEKDLFIKEQEILSVEQEVSRLNQIIEDLLDELENKQEVNT